MKQPICLTETTIHHLLALITMNLQRKKKNVWARKLNNNLLKKVLMLIFTWTFFPWIKCQVAFAIKVLWRRSKDIESIFRNFEVFLQSGQAYPSWK